ncbi:MAG: ABC transporter permease subunit [Dehalococcoidia bacterium]|nr:ABC transporter permease subunit [Dehalococcoidia bacterium]
MIESWLDWDWVTRNSDEIWRQFVEHLQLTGIAVGLGFTIALAASLIAVRFRRTYTPITWVAGALYTIPSLALFAFLVPVTGLSVTTAEVGLVSYTLLILIRNTVAGLDGVPPEVREAARGLGYRHPRLFLEVDLPLALPVIVAGLRIATVTVIGLVTITSIISLGGLGLFILEGVRRNFTTPMVVGTVLTIALAVAADLVLVGAQWLLTPWTRGRSSTLG